jgi:hypothetical protein
MPEIKKDGTKIYHTRDKQYEVESGLLQVYFDALEGIKDIIVNSQKLDDPRIDAMAIYVSSFALNEEEFTKLCEKRDMEIETALKRNKGDAKMQAYARYNANMKAIVRANTLFDRFMGYRVKQEIMRVAPEKFEKEMEEKYPDMYEYMAGKKHPEDVKT